MSSSYSCAEKLRELAAELHRKAYELEECATTLDTLRQSDQMEEEIAKAKEWARVGLNDDPNNRRVDKRNFRLFAG